MSWHAYALSLGAGLMVGALYAGLSVRSPAPPIIALLGLLGMLLGETAVNWVKGHPQIWSWACHSKTFVADATPGNLARPETPTSGPSLGA